MVRKIIRTFAHSHIFTLALLLSACTGLRKLPSNEKLYTGHHLNIKALEGIPAKKGRKALSKDLSSVLRPKPNTKVLWMRPRLWLYEVVDTPKGKGLRYLLRNKWGEQPVLWKNVDPQKNRDIIRNRLENKGFFHSLVTYEIKEKGKEVSIVYTASVMKPYTINEVIYPSGDSSINAYLRDTKEGSLLKPGDYYDLNTLKEERKRMNVLLKNRGLYYFNDEYILFKVDSTIGGKKLNIYITLKEDLPPQATTIYTIKDLYIYPSFSLLRDSTTRRKPDTLKIDDYYYIQRRKRFRPKVLRKAVFLNPGDTFRQENYELTLSRLMGLGAFKFVNVQMKETDSLSKELHTYINLTPHAKRTIRAELRGVSKSNNFVGPEARLMWRNRNLLRGAEAIQYNLHFGFETLINSQQKGVNSYDVGGNVELIFPRFAVPLIEPRSNSRYTPKTHIRLGAQLLSRVKYFSMMSYTGDYGFSWSESATKTHELSPISINYLQLSNTTPTFDSILSRNFFLRQSFQRQFILGSSYSFTFNDQVRAEKKHHFFFNGTADVSGNLLSLLQQSLTRRYPKEDQPLKVLDAPYSQFSRAQLDFRHYYSIGKKQQTAIRLLAGVGVPYGNSRSLPYVKQFFSGGNNSVRAFGPRTLGPGTYRTPDSLRGGFFVDQAGDMRLESNAEYRFPIAGVLRGAAFVDAGNIWLVRNDPNRPGGLFKFNSFYKELGIGTGMGLRIDASYFVLRFDLGVPLRKPFLPEGQRWVGDEIRFADSKWRKENLVLNIAIGYPF